MKLHIGSRAFFGFCIGVTIGSAITLIISAFLGGGAYLPVMPQLSELFPTQIGAATFQFFLLGFIGIVFAEAGCIFLLERLTFLQMCLLHFLTTAVFYLPFLWLCYFRQAEWMLLCILANVLFTYLVTWAISHAALRRNIEDINRRIAQIRKDDRHDGD